MRINIKQALTGAATSVVLALAGVSGTALAATDVVCPTGSHAQGNNCKVTICHRTDSVTNPYVRPDVDISSVDGNGGNDNGQGDHLEEHTGPVATSEAVAQALKDNDQKWGDIIPPVEGIETGLNWTTEGQAIYNNGCNYVTPGSGGENPGTPGTPGTPGAVLGATTQVTTTPKGAVSAGEGGAMQLDAASVAGLASSAVVGLAGVILAVRRKLLS